MLKYILRRILLTIPVLLGVIVIIFTITYFTPGDPAYMVLGSTATEEEVAEWKASVGLDKPFAIQLWDYIAGVVTRRDLGLSYTNNQKVSELIMGRLPISFVLGFLSTGLSIVIAVPFGIIAALKRNSVYDHSSTIISLLGSSMPNFWIAMLLMLLFGVRLGWLPVNGVGTWKHWVMPVFVSALFPVSMMMRTTRSSVLEIVRADYITTARAKGQAETKIVTRHVLRNSMLPVVTVIGSSLSASLVGSLITEVVFSFPGLGLLLSTAIGARNYPIIRGITVVYAIVVCVLNLVVDLIYTAIDPRIKTQFFGVQKKKGVAGI
jgi:peptide/nickel transport system permease protein